MNLEKKASLIALAILIVVGIFILSYCNYNSETCQHKWNEATCESPKTCVYCGATQGLSLGHSFSKATCTEPETCTKCGFTQGSALGHTT